MDTENWTAGTVDGCQQKGRLHVVECSRLPRSAVSRLLIKLSSSSSLRDVCVLEQGHWDRETYRSLQTRNAECMLLPVYTFFTGT